MNDDSLNLSAIDPLNDPARLDGVTAAIVRDAMAARARRAAESTDIFAGVVAWRWATLVAAAAAFVLAAAALVVPATAKPGPASATDVLGIPRQFADLLHSARTPSLAEIHEALVPGIGQ